jgi:lipoprotein-releasing system permease protein
MGNSIRARRYVIAGIYCTHLMEFDNNFIFADLSALVKLNGWEKDQVSGLEISVGDYDSITEDFINVVHKINGQIDRYGDSYFVCTIEQLYPSLFAWLGLLDMNVWVILILMLAVAGFTMISGLLIIILERTNMIGVLKALGATNKSIRHIFLYFAIFIIGKGLIYGNILGLGLCLLQKYFSIIHLDAQSYYVDTVPILINPLAIVLLNLVTLIISVLVLVIPSFLVSHIHPARSIRFE